MLEAVLIQVLWALFRQTYIVLGFKALSSFVLKVQVVFRALQKEVLLYFCILNFLLFGMSSLY